MTHCLIAGASIFVFNCRFSVSGGGCGGAGDLALPANLGQAVIDIGFPKNRVGQLYFNN